MTVVKASIDLGAGPADRVQQLMRILANVLEDTDAGPDRVDRRRWIAWTFLYILWHEGRGATTRRQDGGGPVTILKNMDPLA